MHIVVFFVSELYFDMETTDGSPSRNINHEVQEGVTFHEAGGSLDKHIGCPKTIADPLHHKGYFSVDSFNHASLGALPSVLESKRCDIFEYLKCWAELTVRIHGHFISENRPEKWANGSPYLFSERRGQRFNTVGSGWVNDVGIVKNEAAFTEHIQRCEECRNSRTKRELWYVGIMTARHVVFDQNEVDECEVVFFDHTDDGMGKISLTSGFKSMRTFTEHDVSCMSITTHDEEFINRLQTAVLGRDTSLERLRVRWPNSEQFVGLVFLFSYPHG